MKKTIRKNFGYIGIFYGNCKKKSDKYNNLKVRNEKILKLIFPAILYLEKLLFSLRDDSVLIEITIIVISGV